MSTAIKEKPILFSGAMVRAILAGDKTQTRRVVTNRNSDVCGSHWNKQLWAELDFENATARTQTTIALAIAGSDAPFDLHLRVPRSDDSYQRVRPLWEVGDRLWVRETWQQSRIRRSDRERFVVSAPAPGIGDLHYAATCDGDEPPTWRPSIHMPRWASRLTLEITEVRVQRVQEISAEDAKAEGVDMIPEAPASLSHRTAFAGLWDNLNSKRGYSWDSNPWVWALTFKRVEN